MFRPSERGVKVKVQVLICSLLSMCLEEPVMWRGTFPFLMLPAKLLCLHVKPNRDILIDTLRK